MNEYSSYVDSTMILRFFFLSNFRGLFLREGIKQKNKIMSII